MRAPSAIARCTERVDNTRPSRRAENPLQRGSACLNCRKRKMKCDARKPQCLQCEKAHRASDCVYDDGRQKSRSQILQEKIAKLEDRIRELDNSSDPSCSSASASTSTSSSPFYHAAAIDPAGAPQDFSAHRHSPLSLIGAQLSNSPPSALFGAPSPEYGESSSGSSQGQAPSWSTDSFPMQSYPDYQGNYIDPVHQGVDSSAADAGAYMQRSSEWWEPEDLALRDRNMLLDIFLPHSRQCGFEVHSERLRAARDGAPDAPHPALMNAIYVLACHFSRSPTLAEHEPRFLTRALRGISAALEHSDRLVNVVQASSLLAVYFFAKARLLEGYYHSSSAARLAVALGLHQIRTPVWRPQQGAQYGGAAWNGSPSTSVPLPPPHDAVELGERILAFWQVFVVDRCWSVATGLPSSLPDDDHPQLHISSVWPRPIYDFENDMIPNIDYSSLGALQHAIPPSAYPVYTGIEALRAKAAAFFERAARIASHPAESGQWEQLCQTEFALARFTAALPSFATVDPQSGLAGVETELVVVHTLAHVAAVQLHHPFAQKEAASHDKCVDAARAVTGVIRQLAEPDYAFLDPIVGTCWMCVSDVFIRERMWSKDPAEAAARGAYPITQELDTVIGALKQLSVTFPLALYQAQKIEQSRNMPAY